MKFRLRLHAFDCVLSLGIVALAGSVSAQEPDPDPPERKAALPEVDPDSPSGIFGIRGQVAISSDAGLYIQNTSTTGAEDSSTVLVLRPAFDYFLMDNLSLGGFLGIEYQSVPTGQTTTWAIGPRIGYNIPVSSRFSFWPKAGFSFASTSQSVDQSPGDPEGESVSSTSLALNLFAPVMFHPVQHFFLGFGPALDVDLTGDVKTTVIAGRLTIGGWL